MKATCAFLAVLALMLSGCTVQTAGPSAVRPASPQTMSAADAEVPEKTTQSSETVMTAEGVREDENSTFAEESTETEDIMRLLIGETEVPVTWEENASVDALKGLCPLTIPMSVYGGFEQVGPIGQSIVRDDKQTSTSCGDIVLYSGNQIVIFYGSNSWAYTRLGHINLSQQEMRDLLGGEDVIITLE